MTTCQSCSGNLPETEQISFETLRRRKVLSWGLWQVGTNHNTSGKLPDIPEKKRQQGELVSGEPQATHDKEGLSKTLMVWENPWQSYDRVEEDAEAPIVKGTISTCCSSCVAVLRQYRRG